MFGEEFPGIKGSKCKWTKRLREQETSRQLKVQALEKQSQQTDLFDNMIAKGQDKGQDMKDLKVKIKNLC